jgi:type I restriction enzyme M protein
MTDSAIISKIWNLANVLRDDGVGYGDYLEQITYLLFLKMADELNKPPYNSGLKFPRLKDVEDKEIEDGDIFAIGKHYQANGVLNWKLFIHKCFAA